MSLYCKAYRLGDLRKFKGWTEKSENARKEKIIEDGEEKEVPRKLTDDVYVYLHDSYVVTDGIFENENVLFDNVTPEWKEFCTKTLKFEVPTFEPPKVDGGSSEKKGTDKETEAKPGS